MHAQDVIHLDLKPENVMLRPSGEAVLLDFGFARHARYPDLLGEEQHFAAGSAAYVSPEQLQDDRSDPRSDLYALGVLLYELATGTQPFGEPADARRACATGCGASRCRRARCNADVPPWLQEVILHCLEHDAAARYQSAAHVALDLRHPEQVVTVGAGATDRGAGLLPAVEAMVARAARRRSPLADERRSRPRAVVILVAVDTEHPDDERHSPLQWTTRQIVSLNPRVSADVRIGDPQRAAGRRAAPSSRPRPASISSTRCGCRHWVEPLKLAPSRVSLHVVEAANAADTLLELARANHVDLIVLGAPVPSQEDAGMVALGRVDGHRERTVQRPRRARARAPAAYEGPA